MEQNPHAEKIIEKIITATDPQFATCNFKSGGRIGNEGVFSFCRKIKLYFNSYEEAEPALRRWHGLWCAKITDETGRNMPYEEVYVEFSEVWDKVKLTGNGIPIEVVAKAQSRETDGQRPSEINGYGSDPERFLALVCYELSLIKEPGPFWISGYDAAEVMGLDRVKGQRRASRALKVFENMGLITTVEIGNALRATRYRYTGSSPEADRCLREV